MVNDLFSINEVDFLLNMSLSLLAWGFLRGAERKGEENPTGIGTNCFVIGWSMIFAPYLLSRSNFYIQNCFTACYRNRISRCRRFIKGEFVDKRESKGTYISNKKSVNLTTASCIWFSDDIRMTIGFDYFIFIVLISIAFVI